MAGEIHDRRVPRLLNVDQGLRRQRLIAARRYVAGSVPRLAIMLGHWDAGEIVRLGAEPAPRRKRNRKARGA